MSITLTLDDLAHLFDELMTESQPRAEGFTIGKGKKLYWYITPYPKSCLYRCVPIEESDGELGWPRWCSPYQKVTVHYPVRTIKDSMKIYDLHSPKDKFYGFEEPKSLKSITAHAESMGLNMINHFIPNGLNSYEEQHHQKAVIYDVTSEDVIMIEKEETV